ncbi:centriolin isoform X1 [Perca flavescens]|uniref:centriolin isoform X1 n=1 Tax=Perca flavescens TaxID=8167 RepID=UPI00106E8D62|nr:centriolin-like isoform X1 [Perca flavescens]
MEEQRETGGGAESQGNRGGIRYITEALLLKQTGCQSLAMVRSLNLSSNGDKRIKFIENLHGCQRLQVLNLNHNLIQSMERLNALTQLRELQLAHNNIQRIEGLELMSSLQHLNLSHNRINHIPVWLPKKLHSLHTLHLQHNLITSLYEVSRLRSLSSLSELSVSGNPASSLPHSRFFLLYHVRTLDRLDDLPITQDERRDAHQRFSAEELERLQQEVDSSQSELSRLQREQLAAVTRIKQQEETNQTLTAHTETQRHTHTLREQELHTKSQLLEKTTAELTRALHRLYELEQELTFYKIDAKLNPLPPCSVQDVVIVDSVAESPYIGKARHIRNTITSAPQNSSSSPSLQTQEGSDLHTDMGTSHPFLEDCKTEQSKAEVDLQLTHQTELQTVAEHRVPEETKSRQQEVLCCLFSKLSVLEQLRDEADETKRQMDRQTDESRKKERETEELETQLLTLDTTDPQHAHVTARLSSWRQLLDRMNGKQSELEGRLDDMLSRIAMETQEIKELEQQLTDGQILANEVLQRDLEGIISGLQEYLRGLRKQAHRAQQQVDSLQAENQSLQLHLEDTQAHCRQLEDTARAHRQDMSVQQEKLSVLRTEAQALRDRQVDLEAELKQLREELTQQITMGQLECDSLQAAVDKEKHTRKIRESQLQSTIETLHDEKVSLQQVVQRLQVQRDQTKAQLHQARSQYEDTRTQLDQTRIQLDQITTAILDPQEVQSGPEDKYSNPVSPEDMLSRSVEQLYRAIQQTRTSTEQLQQDQNHSQKQIARLQAQLAQDQDHVTQLKAQVTRDQDHIAQLEAQVTQDQDHITQLEAQVAQDHNHITQLEAQVTQDQDHITQLEAQVTQDQDHITQLEAQVAQDHDHITQLQSQVAQDQDQAAQLESQVIGGVEQDQEPDWRLQEELERLRVRLHRSQSRNRHVQHKLEGELKQSALQLQDVQQERDALLQQLRSQSDGHQRSLGRLNRKLRQLSRSMCDSDQLTVEQLKSASEQLRALNHMVENSVEELDGSFHQPEGSSERQSKHTPAQQSEHTHTVEELRAKLDKAQRHTHRLRQKLDRTRTRTSTRDGGQWYFVPPGQSSLSLGSLGTQDSGLGLQYLSSPERGRQQDRPPTGGGYWVYIPLTHTDSDTAAAEWRDSGGGSDADRSSREQTPPPPTAPGAAVSAGLSDGQTPLVGPAWLLCGSPAAVVYSPPGGGASLHCNIPEHRDTQGDRCVCECVHKEAERLEEERKKLRLETKQLRLTLKQHSSVMQVCDEVECVEKTLLKRRAELRQADRLLLEAQSSIHTARDKASSAQRKADVLQRSAQESAICLLEATQHVRALQEDEVEELRRRQEKERMLREVEEALRSREQEFQRLCTKIHSASDRLSDVLSDLQKSQERLNSFNIQVEQQEQRLVQRSEEHQTAVNRVEEVREEEQRLQNRVKELFQQHEALLSKKSSTVSAMREDELKLITVQSELNTHRAELKQVLQELLVEQQDLEVVKTKRIQTLQRLHKKQDQLDRIQVEVDRAKDELDRIQVEADKKRDELDGTQDEVDKRKDELENKKEEVNRKIEELDRKREEMAELQQKVESHKKETEICLKETKQQQTELQELQEELSRRREERRSLQEQCKHLEARRRHADRSLSAVEVELTKQREEHSHAQLLKQEVVRDTAANQEEFKKHSELLSLLSEQVEERKKHLQTLEQEMNVCSQQQQQRAEHLKELARQIEDKQAVCVGLEDFKAAASQLEDRGHRLTQQQLQLNQIKEELWQREKQLIYKEEELKQQEEELQLKEEGLQKKREELPVKEVFKDSSEESEEDEDKSFYLSTAGLRSAFSSEEERWKVELQREKLKQQEDQLKARLRCRLWNQQENMKVRRLEAEESLLGLKHRLNQLDSLLTHTP